MVTIAKSSQAKPSKTSPELESAGSVVLSDISWELYEKILEAFGERRLRHTYVDGMLEIMSPLHVHEWRKKFIGRLIEMMAWRTRVPIKSAGSTTLRKKLKRRGLEPDESYYVANEPVVRGRDELDLRTDPPPDLAVEVDVTHKSLSRLEAYAKLGVPEIWRHDGEIVQFLKLDSKGTYTPVSHSVAFPRVASADIRRFLNMLSSQDENTILDSWVSWLDSRQRQKK
jgi:Uma2 family endonuclease